MHDLTDADLAEFLAEEPNGPVVMCNLMRFQPDGGRQLYQRYLDAAKTLPGGEVEWLYYGALHPPLEFTQQFAWDAVILARYPSRVAFVDALQSPAYQDIRHLRDAALADSIVQPSTALLH